MGDIREKTDQSEDNVSVHCQHCQPSVSKDEDDVQNRGGAEGEDLGAGHLHQVELA